MNRFIKNAVLSTVIAATALSSLPAEAARRHRGDALAAGLAGVAIGAIVGGALAQPRPQRVYIDPPAPVYVRPSYAPPPYYYQPVPVNPRPALGYDPTPAVEIVEYYRPAPVYRLPAPIYRPAPTYRVVEYYQRPAYRRPIPVYRAPAPGYRTVEYLQQRPFYGRSSLAYHGLTPWTRDWYTACSLRYRSFDPRSGTFLGYDGRRHFCRAG